MSDRQLLPASPFSDFQDQELPRAQAAAKRYVEEITNTSVLPFEMEKHRVSADHAGVQRNIWGENEDEKYPVELPTAGA